MYLYMLYIQFARWGEERPFTLEEPAQGLTIIQATVRRQRGAATTPCTGGGGTEWIGTWLNGLWHFLLSFLEDELDSKQASRAYAIFWTDVSLSDFPTSVPMETRLTTLVSTPGLHHHNCQRKTTRFQNCRDKKWNLGDHAGNVSQKEDIIVWQSKRGSYFYAIVSLPVEDTSHA